MLQVWKRYPSLQERPSNYRPITLLITLYKWRHCYVQTMTPQPTAVDFLPFPWIGTGMRDK